jgi:hypothetical protein
MEPLSEDTIGDKVIRFVIGAFLGAVSGVLGLFYWGTFDAMSVLLWVGASMAVTGTAAVILGNRFIERSFPERWWDWWD